MNFICVKNLHSGMVLGVDVVSNGKMLLKRGTILTDEIIKKLSSLLSSDKELCIKDLTELKPLLIRDSLLSRRYVDFLVNQFKRVFITALLGRIKFDTLLGLLDKYLFTNRQALYELIVLRSNHCYTYEHSLNVALYSLIIGLNEGLTDYELQILVLGCALHDLGKRNISNVILDKPSRLTDSEFLVIKRHPLYGANLVHGLSFVDDRIESIILQHHEKLDGTGYPCGVDSSKITHLARVAAVADIFDAVKSQRVYHKKRSVLESIDILNSDVSRGKIAGDEVDNLIKSLTVYPINTIVKLNNGKVGIVMKNCNKYPIVMGYDNIVYDLSRDKGLRVEKVL